MEVIAIVAAVVVAFVGGFVVATIQDPTIQAAIAKLREAETNAQAIIATIAAHKAS